MGARQELARAHVGKQGNYCVDIEEVLLSNRWVSTVDLFSAIDGRTVDKIQIYDGSDKSVNHMTVKCVVLEFK